MKGFYSPIDQLAAQLPRTKGTGAEFMTELSKRPGYKPQEAQDRELQTLMALPKMERAQFLAQLKAKPPVIPKAVENDGTDDPKYLTPEERNYGGNEGQAFHEQYTLPGGDNYREILLQHPQGKFKGVSEHFGGEPNILASIRAKDRKGSNGEKILHLEEIQSDWHQQGRDRGYLAPDTTKQLEAAKLAHLRLKEQLEQAKSSSNAYERKLKSNMPLYQDPVMRERLGALVVKHNNDIMDLMPQVMKAEAERQGLEEETKYGVPNAPFKKNWHELALKKMIHHAAENGYDSIAITPGEAQADRYGLTDPKKRKGMKGFYDKMIPDFLNQFGKKYGAQVGTMPLPIEGGIEPGWVTKPAAPRAIPVHHFPITPQMREDVTKNGVPLYAKGGKVKPIGYTKEKVTVSPNLDQMRYEMVSVKRFKKAK